MDQTRDDGAHSWSPNSSFVQGLEAERGRRARGPSARQATPSSLGFEMLRGDRPAAALGLYSEAAPRVVLRLDERVLGVWSSTGVRGTPAMHSVVGFVGRGLTCFNWVRIHMDTIQGPVS